MAERDLRRDIRFYFTDHETFSGKAFDIVFLVLNFVFVILYVLGTYRFDRSTQDLIFSLELVVLSLLIFEYLLRLYATQDRSRFVRNFYSIIDLLAIVPPLILLALPSPLLAFNLNFIKSLRIFRFFRLIESEEFFFGVVSNVTLRVLKLLLTIIAVFFVSAGFFYSVENAANPEVANFGDAFYYVVVTLTTVGFGDIVPRTAAGRAVTLAALIAGILLIPWQASQIVKLWVSRDKEDIRCSNCGLRYHEPDASHCKSCGEPLYHERDSRPDEYLR